ncbi:MAG: TonB-dependent receptor, partial [Ferruginibacter sp.]
MDKIIILLLMLGCCGNAVAQGKISISVLNEQQQPIENVTVVLLRSKDSALLKTSITDKNGRADFDHIKTGDYLLKAMAVNFITRYSAKISITTETPATNVPPLLLVKNKQQLNEVLVTTRKPFIQRLNDRIVVNVDNSIINAGSSAMDVLEKSPGVNIDQNDVIGLRGKQGVIIMIDGKPSPMTGADLANYLRGLPSAAIDRIDIISNPSSKYDAAGNAGIIDIHMKKDQRIGTNGTFTAGYGQGVYPKTNTGVTFNYRNKKVNVFGNYNYAYRINLNHLVLDRNFYNNGTFSGQDKKDNYSKTPFNTHTGRLGADFFPDKKTIIGFVVNSNFSHINRTNDNNSLVIDDHKNPLFTFKAFSSNHDHQGNVVGNINYKHTFDSTGKELTADIDYGSYFSGSLSRTATQYFNLNGSSQQPDYILDGDQDGRLILRTAKMDFTDPLKKSAKLEMGFKSSYVSSDNDAKFFDASSGTPQNDTTKTNHFFYDEYNNAAYLNYSRDFKKYDIQFGLRGEQTNVKTRQAKGDIRFDTAYFQLFPSAFFNYKLAEDKKVGVSVSRRIDRPGYSQLNPFLFLIDVTTYATGNPALLPQLTWSYELNYTVKDLNLTLNYSHTKNNQNVAIARFKDVFPNAVSADNVTVQIPVNIASSDYIGLNIASPFKINKCWNMITDANLYYNHFNGSLGGTTLNNGKPAYDVRLNNAFTFKKGWSAEL